MYSTTYAGCSPQHTPTIYQGTCVVGVCCGRHYMLWVYVVGNIVKNGKCAPQHIICCGEHVHVVDNICEHVIHNIGKCCPQHAPTTQPQYKVCDMTWRTRDVLWGTCCGQHWWTCSPQHRHCYPQHAPTTCNPQHIVNVLHNIKMFSTSYVHNICTCWPQDV